MTKYILLILFTPLVSHCQLDIKHGTITITVINQDTIWMGADSRFSFLDSTNHEIGCKINYEKKVYFTFAGIYNAYSKDGETTFEAIVDMKKMILEENSIDSILYKFNNLSLSKLNILIAELKKEFPKRYERLNEIILEGVMVTFENGKPTYRHWGYKLEKETGKITTVTISDFGFIISGTKESVIEALLKNPNQFARTTFSEAIENMIVLQAKSTPEAVGLPAVIYKITSQGHIVLKKGACD